MFSLSKVFLFFSIAFTFFECTDRSGQLFQNVDPESSGVTFSNNLIYTDTLTVLDFEYLYNGGGVGIGDINNDGLLDVYFSGNMTSGKLYLNKGNWKFEDITVKAGLTTSAWVNGVTMVDINQDGFKDISCALPEPAIRLPGKRRIFYSSTTATIHSPNPQHRTGWRGQTIPCRQPFLTMTGMAILTFTS